MGLTDSNGGLSAADVAAVMNGNGNNGWGGFGGDGTRKRSRRQVD